MTTLNKQPFPVKRIMDEFGGIKPVEFEKLRYYSPIEIIDQIALIRSGLEVTPLTELAYVKAAA